MPFELFGQAWVLFRDAEGRPACVLDECAHRACPLSIGRVVDGQVECLYHGACWKTSWMVGCRQDQAGGPARHPMQPWGLRTYCCSS